ncbi:Na+ dependent nucleoside transporter C-terminus-domain-containing protein [Annulohypoxylon moriforme]|nr:Na+ dependent nucleoside transporter C-terminus-domain-containing protein [Annulohypoxylon moriforme]
MPNDVKSIAEKNPDGLPEDLSHGFKDTEVGTVANTEESRLSRFYYTFRPLIHFLIWALWTTWWCYGLVYYRNSPGMGWLIPFLLWLAITIRIVTLWVPATHLMKFLNIIWTNTVLKIYDFIPKKLHQPLAAIGTVAVFLVGTMVPEETTTSNRALRAQALFGLLVMIGLLAATSHKREMIPWHTVISGLLAQFIVAIFVLRIQAGYDIFGFISYLARTLLEFAKDGVAFITDEDVPALTWFFITVVPAIIFFVALVSLLEKLAAFFFWAFRVSGPEAVVASATPFVGMGEAPVLIRPFVPYITAAEIHQIMTCGFATIAGSVLVAYIGMGLNPQALISSCIMSIPASLALSKLRYPETEETVTTGNITVPEDLDYKSHNSLHAFTNGAWLGLKIAGMIICTILCIIAFVSLINALLGWWGGYWGMLETKLSLELILGYLFYPVAWLLGVPNQDLLLVGQLIGTKIVVNEFSAFAALTSTDPASPYFNMLQRSKLIATYACCGFGNIGSLGIEIGVLSQLAPSRSGDVSRLAVSALLTGILATLSSASIAGMLSTSEMA